MTGVHWTPEKVAAFRADHAAGLSREELAQRHGLASADAVSRSAGRLNLPKRKHEPHALKHGSWQKQGWIMVWVAHA